jgi:hypothetical protein
MGSSVAHLSYDGHMIETGPEAIAAWSIATMVSPLELVGLLHWALYFAMPGKSVGELLRMIEKAIQQLHENITIIDDTRTNHVINLILPSLEAFVTAAHEIHDWQKKNVPKKTRTTHNRAVRKHGPHTPPWYDDKDFKTKLQTLSSAFSLYLNSLTDTIPTIREILPSSAPASWSEQLDRTLKQIPDFRLILEVGYEEAARRKAIETGYLPSA